MKKMMLYCLLAVLCPADQAFAQTKTALHIGDVLPSLVFSNVLNHADGLLYLPAANNKIIILDFFATWCGGCIKELPRLAALQDSMQGKLQIVLVSRESKEKLQAFLKKRPVAKAFAIVYEDSLLNHLFPNRLLPHDVWIDGKGIVAAITSSEQVTYHNLGSLLTESRVDLPVKNDIPRSPAEQPLRELGAPNILWESFFSTAIAGAGNLSAFVRWGNKKRLLELNASRLRLYQSAWGMPASKMLLRVHAPQVWPDQPQKGESWVLQHHYCYELTGPDSAPVAQYRQRMKTDLDHSFNCISWLDSADMPVYILTPVACNSIMPSGSRQPEAGGIQYDAERATTTIYQQPLPAIVRWLNSKFVNHYNGFQFVTADGSGKQLYTVVIQDAQLTTADSLAAVMTDAGIAVQATHAKTQVLIISQSDR